MDTSARFMNWMGILISMVFGIVTAWFIYRQTKKRADELEALEGSAKGNSGVHRTLEDEVDLDMEDSEDDEGPAKANGHSNETTYKD